MRFIITIMMLIVSSVSFSADWNSTQCTISKSLNNEQKQSIEWAYEQGKPHDLGITLASIILIESSAALYNVNWNDPSFSMFHINLTTAVSRHSEYSTGSRTHDKEIINRISTLKDKAKPLSQVEIGIFELKNRLMKEPKFAADNAITEMKFWINYHKKYNYGSNVSVWIKAWGSYNAGGGSRWEKYGKKYSDKMLRTVRKLKDCL